MEQKQVLPALLTCFLSLFFSIEKPQKESETQQKDPPRYNQMPIVLHKFWMVEEKVILLKSMRDQFSLTPLSLEQLSAHTI